MLSLAALVSLALAEEPAAPTAAATPSAPAAAATTPAATTPAATAPDSLQIELLEPKLKGPLDEKAVGDALSASAPIRDCMTTLAPVYEGVAMPYWTRAALALTIEPDGHVSKGTFKDTYPAMPAIEACVAKAVTATTFPASTDGKKTSVAGQLKLTKTKPG